MSEQKKSQEEGQTLRAHHGAVGLIGITKGADTPYRSEDMAVRIGNDGVFVGGRCLVGCTQWEIVNDYGQGVLEVQLRLVASSLSVDLNTGSGSPRED